MSNSLWKIWDEHPPLTISGTSYTLRGWSWAALRTNFYIKELGIMLDAGLSANYSPDHIFCTHGHADHSASLPFHLYSAKEGQRIQVYVPTESLRYFQGYIGAAYSLSAERKFDDRLCCGCDLIPAESDKVIPLIISKKPIDVEVIKCHHSVPCVGYGFVEKRQKLKDQYVGLSGKEISELRKSGEEITSEVSIPFFCFLGDTSQVVLENPKLLKYKTIMIECTFILPDEMPQADKTQHMHWNYLEPFVKAHPEINFILYHFSQRYRREDITAFFTKLNLPNVTAWVN